MAHRLDTWPDFECEDVRRMAAVGMSARAIARATGSPLGSILSAAPECFEHFEVREGPGFCEGCRRRLADDRRRRCKACGSADKQELVERVRVLRATGAQSEEIAEVLETTPGMVTWALGMATKQRLHRQKPMKSRA